MLGDRFSLILSFLPPFLSFLPLFCSVFIRYFNLEDYHDGDDESLLIWTHSVTFSWSCGGFLRGAACGAVLGILAWL